MNGFNIQYSLLKNDGIIFDAKNRINLKQFGWESLKMDKVIHAHALMDFIQENPNIVSKEDLKSKFEEQYGEVQFTNCTNQVYNFEEIYIFLAQRNKIISNSEGIEVIKEHQCDH